jgi:2-methylisocitrate lyase-like PEP mutase family enzyme
VELKAHSGLLDDLKRIAQSLTIPCTVNIDAGGPLLGLPASELHLHGVALAIYPALLRNAVGFAMREALQQLQTDGHTLAAKPRQLSAKEYNDCLGLPEVEKWEAKFPV